MSPYFALQSTLRFLFTWLPPVALLLVIAGCGAAPPTPLASAAAADDVGKVSALLAEESPNTLELQIALAWAARAGASQAARALLDAGAPLDGDDGRPAYGWTPLICALHSGRWKLARELLDWGASPNVAARNGTTPLMMITGEGEDDWHIRMVEDLLLAGADPRAVNEDGASALSNAIANSNLRIAARLLAAAPDLRLPEGFTGTVAGALAVMRGDDELVDR
jgi:hypothetical protein